MIVHFATQKILYFEGKNMIVHFATQKNINLREN